MNVTSGAAVGGIGVLITNGDTHAPALWTHHILEELVPLVDNATLAVQEKVAAARMKLWQAVEDAMAAIRLHERKAFDTFNSDEREAVGAMYRWHHGLSTEDVRLTTVHEYTHGKLRPVDNWLDDHVRKICRIVNECDGEKVASVEMMDAIYRVLWKWFTSIQYTERSHYVTDNGFV